MENIKVRRINANNIVKRETVQDELYCKWETMQASLFTEWYRREAKSHNRYSYDIIKVDFSHCSEETMTEVHKGFTLWNEKKEKEEQYFFLYRGNGSAKNGTAIFIHRRLRNKAERYLNMRYDREDARLVGELDLVSISAYRSLPASTIKATTTIHPHEILIVDDYEYSEIKKALIVEADENGILTSHEDDTTIESSLFDGMGLIQSDLVPDMDGFVLLRNHFTKCCAFKFDIQQFYRDTIGEMYYDKHMVTDMFGNVYPAKNIKLIMCKSSVKWAKYPELFDYTRWHDAVGGIANGSIWGIVKDGHDSKYGELGESNYQFHNAVNPKYFDELMETSEQFMRDFGKEENILNWLGIKASAFSNKAMYFDTLRSNINMFNTEWINYHKQKWYKEARNDIKNGRPLLHGGYKTVCSNPMALARHSLGLEPIDNFKQEDVAVQVYCKAFDFDTYLSGSRSPFNSKSNFVYLHNVYDADIDKYMDTGKNIIIVNSRSDIQAKCNGMDYDGDTLAVFSDSAMVKNAREAVLDTYPIVNLVSSEKVPYTVNKNNIYKAQAHCDYSIKRSQSTIGISSNDAQKAQTLYWNTEDRKYLRMTDELAIVAQIAIDSAKKNFNCDLQKTIRAIEKEIGEKSYPWWWNPVTDSDKKETSMEDTNSPMALLRNYKFPRYKKGEVIPTEEVVRAGNLNNKEKPQTRDFVDTTLLEFAKERHNIRLGYMTALNYCTTQEAQDEAYSQWEDKMNDLEEEARDAMDNFFKRKKNRVQYIQYMMWYTLTGDIDMRTASDIMYWIYKVYTEDFIEAIKFNN